MAVYFFQVGDDGPIKIGVTYGVAARFSATQMAMPYELHVRGVIVRGDRALELELHRRFNSHWVRGEWFMPHADLLEYIRTNSAPFDASKIRQPRTNAAIPPPIPPVVKASPGGPFDPNWAFNSIMEKIRNVDLSGIGQNVKF